MTKPPRLAIVVNLFHPQTGEKCIIQPTARLMLWVQSGISKSYEPPLIAFYIVGLRLTKSETADVMIVCVCAPINICSDSAAPAPQINIGT